MNHAMTRFVRMIVLSVFAVGPLSGMADAQSHDEEEHRPPHKARGLRKLRISMGHSAAKPAPAPKVIREIQSELKADTKRAEADIRVQLEKAVQRWLAEDRVPTSWTPPKRFVDRMLTGKVFVEPVVVADLTVYRATVDADFSPDRKRELVETYHRQEGGRRLAIFGGGLAVILACLAGVSGYIRADEATKGYYTNHLRLLAAAGIGATGVAVYQILT